MSDLRKIIHIDMDAFYASVEQRDNPFLRNRPVIVGGNPRQRGVVAACSYEARRFGVHSAMPCAKAAKLCPNAVFTPPRMHRYREVSSQVMAIFLRFTDLVEPLSLDEAFLDVTTNSYNNPSATRISQEIRKLIESETGLTASAGVSFNKFLAKIASDLRKPNGLSVILPDNAAAFLDDLLIGKFFGVGKVTEEKMMRLGIQRGRDLRKFSREDLTHHFGKSGSFFFDIVRGRDDRPVKPSRERKSIGSETTLQYDTVDSNEIEDLLGHLAAKVENSLQRKGLCCATITLKVRYHDFTTITRSLTLHSPIDTAEEILSHIEHLRQSTELGRRKIRLLGITASKLQGTGSRRPVQLVLPFMRDRDKINKHLQEF